MVATRRIIRAFLASPGDLEAERIAVRAAVNEFNESWADELGYQVELVGWEETIAGYGRPQHIINQDLDRCDLFLGMLWKRWGTPPDKEGHFTSGFHEEYERAVTRCEQTGSPEICLFFKEIGDEFKADPGQDLSRVLEFRKEIVAGKSVLYQAFSDPRGMEALARKAVTNYVNRVKGEREAAASARDATKQGTPAGDGDASIANRASSSPLSAEGFEFLQGLVERVGHEEALEQVTALDVARFRLLSNSISKPGNDDIRMGVHDLNLIFANAAAEGIEFGRREAWCLARLGFKHLHNENVPLWRWYALAFGRKHDLAIASSFAGAGDDEKCGAISVLSALGLLVPEDDELRKEWALHRWFSSDSSARVRNAALGYLGNCGVLADFDIAKAEYDRSDSGTARDSLECMVRILLRADSPPSAQLLLLDTQFDSIDPGVLSDVLSGFPALEVDQLMPGLKHRNQDVRFRSLQVLGERRAIESAVAERLLKDDDPSVRKEALEILRTDGREFEEAEVKRILVRPRQTRDFGLFAFGRVAEKTGEDCFSDYQIEWLRDKRPAELERIVQAAVPYDDDAYFVLVKKRFSRYGRELRTHVDGRFGSYYADLIRRVESIAGASERTDLVEKARELEDLDRKRLTRRGLDVLVEKRKKEDLGRVRDNLRSGYAGASVLDARYLERYGEWADIELLANAQAAAGRSSPRITGREHDGAFSGAVARCALAIARASISRLMSSALPTEILQKVIEGCPESRFVGISDGALLGLLDHDSESVRKAASVKAVRSFPSKRTREIMMEYVRGDEHRYYNVIHWLDLGVSMSRADAKAVAAA